MTGKTITTITMIATIIGLSTALSSCQPKAVCQLSHSLSRLGWSEDSVLTYAIPAPDKTNSYTIEMNIRHTENYPYQNLWLFMNDTLEIYLANDRGRWLGNRKNGLVEMPILLEENYVFSADTAYFTIRHGMRDSLLRGITDIMLSVYGKE